MRSCLVTGCTGFIGRHIVETLLELGIVVRGLTRQPTDQHFVPGLELIHGDLGRPDTLANIAKGMDTVIHAAGHAHSQGSHNEVHWETTVEGTRHLLAEAQSHNVKRFIFISSVKAMPEPGKRCLDETEHCLPIDTYGKSRREAEDLVLAVGLRTGLHVSILRPALVYGPGCKGNLAALMRWIDWNLFPPIPETGNIRSMVDVHDLTRAILLATEKPSANGRKFIITDGENYSTYRIYTAIRQALGKPATRWSVPAMLLRSLGKAGDSYEAILRRPAPFNSSACSRLLDSACYRSIYAEPVLGFRPEYCFEDALPSMVSYYQNRRLLK